jgi:hypothetical protein
MATLVIGGLLFVLILILCRMERDPSPDARMLFLSKLMERFPDSLPDPVKHERAYVGRRHHRHRFGV